MRSLILVKTVVGGAWALNQARVLAAKGVEIHVVAPSDGGLMDGYRAFGAQVHVQQTDIAPLARRGFRAARREFRALVDKVRPDVIHSHFVGTTLFARLALGRGHPVPRLFQVPGPLHLENPVTRFGEIATAGKRDYWAASCLMTRDIYLASGVPDRRVGLAYYGVPFDHLERAPAVDLRRELGLDAKARLVGMVAHAYPPKRWLGQRRGLKGHEDLIDAAAILVGQGHDIHCVFVGGPWAAAPGAQAYFESLEARGRERLGARAVFLGHRTDVPSLYRAFDLAVHPSHSENLGGAAESLLMRRPTVATRVGGFPDIVVDGQTGWLAPPKDPPGLAKAIAAALSDPAEADRRAAAGEALARRLLDLDTTAASVLSLYQHMAPNA